MEFNPIVTNNKGDPEQDNPLYYSGAAGVARLPGHG